MDLTKYKIISRIILSSFIICFLIILCLNVNYIEGWITSVLGQISSEVFKQFFYGMLGGTIACSLFLTHDKETNEVESLKPDPDPQVLRMPDSIDIKLYVQRIITSGVLAVLGTLIIIAGFSYLEVDYSNGFILKHKLFFIISSVLIGLFQVKFLGNLEKLFDSFFKK